jgi:hypothetical protein
MERFLVGAALVMAGAIALGSMIGPRSFRFHINDDDDHAVAVQGAPVPSGAQTRYSATEVEVRGAAAILTVIPEDRTDVAVTVSGGASLPAIKSRQIGDRLVLDGSLSRRVRKCPSGAPLVAAVSGIGEIAEGALTRIEVRMPRAVKLDIADGVRAEVGPSDAAEISFAGCAGGKVGDVKGHLEIQSAGSGDVAASRAGSAEVSLAGSGEITLGEVAQGLDASIAGSGSTRARSVTGELSASIAGSGDVEVAGGAISKADVSIAGSGDVEIAAPVVDLDASIIGSGNVKVASVAGALKRSVMGSGGVKIGGVQASGDNPVPAPPTPPAPPAPAKAP